MFVFKIDVLDELEKKGYHVRRIRREKLLGEATIQQLRRGEMVGIRSLDVICDLLQLQPGDVIEHYPEEKTPPND